MINPFYEALLEGRYPIHVETRHEPERDMWIAKFEDAKGQTFESEDNSQAEAHRQCTAKVMWAIRSGEIFPTQ